MFNVSNDTKYYYKEGNKHKQNTEENNSIVTCFLNIFEIWQDDGADHYELDGMKEGKKYASLKAFEIKLIVVCGICIGPLVSQATLYDHLQTMYPKHAH